MLAYITGFAFLSVMVPEIDSWALVVVASIRIHMESAAFICFTSLIDVKLGSRSMKKKRKGMNGQIRRMSGKIPG